MNKKENRLIVLSGGGTLGPVTPLLGVAEKIKAECRERSSDCRFLWLGTAAGPEREFVEREGIEFKPIPGGKLRRYFSLKNFTDLAMIAAGFFRSIIIFMEDKPAVFLSAGGFVSVPAAWAAWILRIPIVIHQQDARAGLANRLMAPFASRITVTFENSLKDYGEKAVWTGNSVRKEIADYKISKREARQKIGLGQDKPVLFAIGGGTGSLAINGLISRNLDMLLKFCQIVHVTGKGKTNVNRPGGYFPFEIMHIDGLIKAYAAADAVLSRCGMGVLTEISYLGKPAILLPMPDSHQEENAAIFAGADAAVVLDQKSLTDGLFIDTVRDLLIKDAEKRGRLSENIKKVIRTDSEKTIAKIVVENYL